MNGFKELAKIAAAKKIFHLDPEEKIERSQKVTAREKAARQQAEKP